MKVLVYDNSFEGFLTAVFKAFTMKESVYIVKESNYQPTLNEVISIHAVPLKSDRLIKGIRRLREDLAYDVYLGWLSDVKGIDNDILDVLIAGFDKGSDPTTMGYLDCVKSLNKTVQRVKWDIQRAYQFVRFSKVGDDLYVADYEPDYAVFPLIANHFYARFSSIRFIIRDPSRQVAIVASDVGWFIRELTHEEASIKHEDNDNFSQMWRSYFKVLSNPQRKNLKAQRQHVPMRYRKHLTEFDT